MFRSLLINCFEILKYTKLPAWKVIVISVEERCVNGLWGVTPSQVAVSPWSILLRVLLQNPGDADSTWILASPCELM